MQAQAASFTASILLGVLFGVLYDAVRFSRVLLFIDVGPPPRSFLPRSAIFCFSPSPQC